MSELIHLSVLAEESPQALIHRRDGIYVDGTFGRGGHTRRILAQLSAQARLIAFDRDVAAIEEAKKIQDPRFRIVHEPFSRMEEVLHAKGITQVDGIFLDIGVSSPQIDDASRGFSFRFDGPLDMRMDTTRGITAAQWLQRASQARITRVIRDYGEERFASAIARKIVQTRESHPLTTTRALADLVASVVPRNKKDMQQHPATRTFQAIRIEVNQELEELRQALRSAVRLLKPRGHLAVISFHSLEDRIVKRFFERMAHPERDIDPRLPMRQEDLPKPVFTDVQRIKPSQQECRCNPRARSAILRVGVRTSYPWAKRD